MVASLHPTLHRFALAAFTALAIGAAAQADTASAGMSLEPPPYNCGGCTPPPKPEYLRDNDGDGLLNGQERDGNTVPRDHSGLAFSPTNPNDPDTDSDGLNDFREVYTKHVVPFGYRAPLRSVRRTDPTVWDTDGDGHSDGLEVLYTKTHPNFADTDRDGLTDRDEGMTHRTHPWKADTDGDRCSDGREVRLGSDPLRFQSPNPCVVVARERVVDAHVRVGP